MCIAHFHLAELNVNTVMTGYQGKNVALMLALTGDLDNEVRT